jgi:hypothetical protein
MNSTGSALAMKTDATDKLHELQADMQHFSRISDNPSVSDHERASAEEEWNHIYNRMAYYWGKWAEADHILTGGAPPLPHQRPGYSQF